ncbi:MAG: hypothetical protein OXI56_12540 [bacterium]|nr:hypothetical protein [bacterium]MDE0602615.1 hypothetical protein [bacterium]
MSLFAEGIRSSVVACSYSVLLVGLALVVLRRKDRMGALGVFAGFTILSAWIRAAGISNLLAGRAATVLLVIGGLALALMVNRRIAGLAGSALLGTFAGATWFPCVGEELGTVLTQARDEPGVALLLLAVYLVGVMIPLVAVMALLSYVPAIRRWMDGRWVALAAKTVLAAMGVLVLMDQYDILLSTVARWSASVSGYSVLR